MHNAKGEQKTKRRGGQKYEAQKLNQSLRNPKTRPPKGKPNEKGKTESKTILRQCPDCSDLGWGESLSNYRTGTKGKTETAE